jgi:6-phosphofructokinase 1
MDTADKLSRYAKDTGYDITIIGLPKTIDNDLPITDHTPGFGSAAKYICASCTEAYLDVRSFDIPYLLLVETMGRNAGWLAASAALVRDHYDAPDLIYLPEVDFDIDKFYGDVNKIFEKKHLAFVVISEGIKNADGEYICERGEDLERDKFGHKILTGSADLLGRLAKKKFGCKVRTIEIDLLQRCAGHLVSAVDINESFDLGKAGAKAALSGQNSVMMALTRKEGSEYSVEISSCPLSDVANIEKKIPREWINKEGNFVTQECIDYIKPLIQGEVYPPMKDGIPNYLLQKSV